MGRRRLCLHASAFAPPYPLPSPAPHPPASRPPFQVSYRSYWVYALLEILQKHRGSISIQELSDILKFRTDDIVKTLQVRGRDESYKRYRNDVGKDAAGQGGSVTRDVCMKVGVMHDVCMRKSGFDLRLVRATPSGLCRIRAGSRCTPSTPSTYAQHASCGRRATRRSGDEWCG